MFEILVYVAMRVHPISGVVLFLFRRIGNQKGLQYGHYT
jgi:hypothetical protein